MLPNFLVIGAAKAGTTSLRTYLGEHPEVFVPDRGEPSFFAHEGERLAYCGPGDDDWTFVTDRQAYERLFDDAEGYAAVGEVSPRYLYFPRAADRIRHHLPDVRLVTVLRHPVDRAYSHFLMNRDRRCEPEADFVRALERGAEREAKGWGWDWQYVGAGRYHEQLARYYERFDERQICVLLYDDLKRDKARFFSTLFTFLGVRPDVTPDTSVRHREAALPRVPVLRSLLERPSALKTALAPWIPAAPYRRVKAAVRAWNNVRPDPLPEPVRSDVMARYFQDDVEKLERLIGADLSHWMP
ncbi:MAG: sulfotransferase [Rubricoccaceae bacterium]|nr:sulfotransferase [Rubricoccaceae bacterium]